VPLGKTMTARAQAGRWFDVGQRATLCGNVAMMRCLKPGFARHCLARCESAFSIIVGPSTNGMVAANCTRASNQPQGLADQFGSAQRKEAWKGRENISPPRADANPMSPDRV